MSKDKRPLPPSLWDDSEDGSESRDRDATKRSGPRPNPNKVFYSDDELDERSDEAFGGFGYSGRSTEVVSDYDYRGSFDDDAEQWYRRSSFRYSRKVDYSPSQLFRSAFSTRHYSYGAGDDAENEVKNKAIRALRALTRSANTLVDKTVKKNEFAVQFSSGADSNGATDKLNEDKQRVVFVSPDDLVTTKTPDEEDAAIDALTGFVLLRVQMAQSVSDAIVKSVNEVNARRAVIQLYAEVLARKRPLAEIDHAALTAEIADRCLAGVLVKSMLMRLARRNVVANWGGFAPYFVRHAKQFASVKKSLESAELSLETLVGRVSYNMIADEEQIDLDADVEALIAKHLGSEVKNDALLETCQKLVKDLREFLTAKGVTAVTTIEESLNEIVEAAKKSDKSKKPDEPTRAALEHAMDGLMSGQMSANGIGREQAKHAENTSVQDKLRNLISTEQLAKQLTGEHADLAKIDRAKLSAEPHFCAARIIAARRQGTDAMAARPGALSDLRNNGSTADQLRALEEALGPGSSTKIDEAALDAITTATGDLASAAGKYIKKQRALLKKEAVEEVEKMAETFRAMLAAGSAAAAVLNEKLHEINRSSSLDATIKARLATMIASMQRGVETAQQELTAGAALMASSKDSIAAARGLKLIAKMHADAKAAFMRRMGAARTHITYDPHSGSVSGGAAQKLRDEVSERGSDLALAEEAGREPTTSDAEWREKTLQIVADFEQLTAEAFLAAAAAGAHPDSLAKLLGNLDYAETKRVAEELGVPAETLGKLMAELTSARHRGINVEKPSALGKGARGKAEETHNAISPIDERLFGARVEKNTKLLTGEAVGHVNDEARNAPEEEYVAYIASSGVSTKPKAVTAHEHSSRGDRNYALRRAKDVLKKHRGTIERIRSALQFQGGKRTDDTYGLRSGDLDEGGLHKLSYDCDHIWSQKTISKLPDVAVGILVDQSGSMGGGKIDRARELCIVFAEALKKVKGVRLYIYGHTANVGGTNDLVIYEHYTPGQPNSLEKLGAIEAHSNNYDGYAIKEAAKRLDKDPAKRKYLFVLSDGLPAGRGYGGDPAQRHVTSVCKFVRERLKIGLAAFAVGISNYERTMFKAQYGDDHIVFVGDVMKCLPNIVRFLRNTLQKEKKLVSID